MSIQEVKDAWLFMDRNTGIWRGQVQAAQGVFQPIHWVAMHRMQCMLRLAPHEGRIVDIGCSYGIFTLNMAWKKPRTQVIGIDPDEQRLEVAKRLLAEHKLANCAFQSGTVDQPNIQPNSCTGVICTETLDHIADVRPRLKETVGKLMDLLMPGGRLILSIPALEEAGKETMPLPPSPLYMKDFDFLSGRQHDRNCPRWWHLFYVDKL